MVRTGVPAWCSRFTERHRSALNLLALVLGYALYLVVGACVFSAVELPYERALRRELKEARDQFLRNNSCVSGARLEELLARALEASNYGVSVLGNDTDRNWDFVSSLFFTSTVLTTTGYGHTVPLSDGGKAFCIFYSLFGIPVTLLFLSAVVQRLVSALTRRPVSYLYRRWAVPRSALAAAHAAALALAVFLLFVVVPSWVFVTTETDWNFLEALYFCFISLTTIGLGDYVPGETHGQTHGRLYRLAVTVYLLLGLVCVLVVLETCCELPQIRRLRHRFYQENVRDLDSETATIITRDHLSDRLDDDAHVSDQVPVIPSVSEQAATLRRNKSVPYTAAAASSVNGKLR